MSKYLLNNSWILNAGKSLPRERSECFGYDLDITTALTAGCNINIKYALQPLRPCHSHPALGWGSVIFGCPRLVNFASFCWGYLDTVFTIRGKYPMKTCQVNSRFRHQCRQPGYEIQWLENDMRGAVAPGCFQLIVHLAIAGQRQAFCGYRWPCDITAQTFQLGAFFGPRGYTCMQREPGDLTHGAYKRVL